MSVHCSPVTIFSSGVTLLLVRTATQTDDVGVLSNARHSFELQDDPDIEELEERREIISDKLKALASSLYTYSARVYVKSYSNLVFTDNRSREKRFAFRMEIDDIDDAIAAKCSQKRSEVRLLPQVVLSILRISRLLWV